ncbi:hypothetical protein I4U23_020165 [Adineta vaga]|nr:hypothetical protein I4U23_020165 [Adineta vaga]
MPSSAIHPEDYTVNDKEETVHHETNQTYQGENSIRSRRHLRFTILLTGVLVLVIVIITIPLVISRNCQANQSKASTITTINNSDSTATITIASNVVTKRVVPTGSLPVTNKLATQSIPSISTRTNSNDHTGSENYDGYTSSKSLITADLSVASNVDLNANRTGNTIVATDYYYKDTTELLTTTTTTTMAEPSIIF